MEEDVCAIFYMLCKCKHTCIYIYVHILSRLRSVYACRRDVFYDTSIKPKTASRVMCVCICTYCTCIFLSAVKHMDTFDPYGEQKRDLSKDKEKKQMYKYRQNITNTIKNKSSSLVLFFFPWKIPIARFFRVLKCSSH